MAEDKKRIGVGNSKFPSLEQEEIIIPEPVFTFDSEEIKFDSTENTFDEEI